MGACHSSATSGMNGGSGGVTQTAEGSITFADGVVEFDGELKYGKKDSQLSSTVRKAIETWENKRRSNKIEYAYSVDANGNPIGPEVKGGRGSVRTPFAYHETPDATFTHIHPRGKGESAYLGGTFSMQDLRNFANKANKTERAAAKEGTYSISKSKNFDKDGFLNMAMKACGEFKSSTRDKQNALNAKYRSGSIDYKDYSKASAKIFNSGLVKLHETLRQNQSKYGYEYTLEVI